MCELLRANLYEFQKYNREAGDALYFTLPRVQAIARQVRAVSFCDLQGSRDSAAQPATMCACSCWSSSLRASPGCSQPLPGRSPGWDGGAQGWATRLLRSHSWPAAGQQKVIDQGCSELTSRTGTAAQVLRSLAFLHSLGLIHSDLKPENILIKSYSRCGLHLLLSVHALSVYAELVG